MRFPGREALRDQVKELLQIGYVSAPSVRTTKLGTNRYFHTKREGTQNQPTLYVRDGVTGKDRVLIDASALSEDGTTALDWWFPSRDGALLAWGRSESGSEESTLFVRDVATGKDLSDKIEHTRHASVAWMPDGKSFYYSRYPEAGSVPPGDEKYFSKIFLHVLGQDAKTDKLVFGEGRDKTDTPIVVVSPDGRWLVVRVHMGWDKSEVWMKDLSKGDAAAATGWVAVAKDAPRDLRADPAQRSPLHPDQRRSASLQALRRRLRQARSAPRGRRSSPRARTCSTTSPILKNEIVTTYMHEASTRIERFGLDGKTHGPVALPVDRHRDRAPARGTARRRSSRSRRTSCPRRSTASICMRARRARRPRSSSPGRRSARSSSASDIEVERLLRDLEGRHARPDVRHREEGDEARREATRRSSTATAASTSTRRPASARARSRA